MGRPGVVILICAVDQAVQVRGQASRTRPPLCGYTSLSCVEAVLRRLVLAVS